MEALGAPSSVGKMHQALVCSVQTPALSTAHITQASPTICSNSLKPSSLTPLRTCNRHSSAICNGNGGNLSLRRRPLHVVCGGLRDFIGGDLLGFDLDKWASDVEKYGALAVYAPAEGGYEGRYAVRLKSEGYHFMNISARGLGDPEAYLTKVHGVRPPHLGKQAVARWYLPPDVDYRLSLLPKTCKGLVLWVIEAKVLSKAELQFLALLPALRPNVKVIAECGTWREYRWKPLTEVSGVPAPREETADAAS